MAMFGGLGLYLNYRSSFDAEFFYLTLKKAQKIVPFCHEQYYNIQIIIFGCLIVLVSYDSKDK